MLNSAFRAMLLLGCMAAVATAQEDDWPQWRGRNRDGHSPSQGLLKEWPEGGPKVVWHQDGVGIGYSSMAVTRGRVITQGDINGVEQIIALDAEDGRILWSVQPDPVARQLAEQVTSRLKQMDRDEDGLVSEVEALQGIGWNFNESDQKDANGNAEEIAAARAARLMPALDKNSDEQLTPAEVPQAVWQQFARIDSEDPQADAVILAAARAAEWIKLYDADENGTVSKQETQNKPLGHLFDRIEVKETGTNQGDGALTAEEMCAYLLKSEPGRDGLLTETELRQFFTANFAGKDGILTADELRHVYGGYRNSYGDGPRGTPTVAGDLIFTEGGSGDVACLDFETGKTIWHLNLPRDLAGGRPGWGYCESPLVEGDLLIVTPGGDKGTLAALNRETGDVIWRSTDVKQGAHYASPQVAEIAGVRQVVQFARENVFGVTLDGGKLLWSYGKANNGTANIATPLIHADHVFASSGYGTGGGLVKVQRMGEGFTAEEQYFEKKMANHHGGLVLVGDHMYGFGNNGLTCMNFLTGEIAWTARSVSKGSVCYADGMLYLLGEGHEVALAEATPEEYREHGRFSIPNLGRSSWAHPVVAGGRLYIRNLTQLTAYDVRAE